MGDRNKCQDSSVKCCVTATSRSHAAMPVFWRSFLEDTPNTFTPNGTIGFLCSVKQSIGEASEAPLTTLICVQLCPLPTPKFLVQKIYSCRVSHSSTEAVWPLTLCNLDLSPSDLWRSCFNNGSWGFVFMIFLTEHPSNHLTNYKNTMPITQSILLTKP